MALGPQLPVALNFDSRTGVDVTEVLGASNKGALYIRRGEWTPAVTGAAPLVVGGFTAIGGGGAVAGTAFAVSRQDGSFCWRGISGKEWLNGKFWDEFQVPVGQRLTDGAVADAQAMEYCFRAVIKMRTPFVANCPFAFGLFAESLTFPAGTQPGHCLYGDPSLSVNWLVYRRTVVGGAATQVNTGIPLTTEVSVEYHYIDSPSPESWVSVQGVHFDRAGGLANVPVLADGSGLNWRLGWSQGSVSVGGSVAGQEYLVRQCRFYARELENYG